MAVPSAMLSAPAGLVMAAWKALARYTDGFYNPIRRRSALNLGSPAHFERRADSQTGLH